MGQMLGCCGGKAKVDAVHGRAGRVQTWSECVTGLAKPIAKAATRHEVAIESTGSSPDLPHNVQEEASMQRLLDTVHQGAEAVTDAVQDPHEHAAPPAACSIIRELVLLQDEDSAASQCCSVHPMQVDSEMMLVESSTAMSESMPSQQCSCTATEVSEETASLGCGSEDPLAKNVLDVECPEQPQSVGPAVTVLEVAAHVLPPAPESCTPSSAVDTFLVHILSAMDCHLQQLRWTQQWLVALVELACRWALSYNFRRLELVGSVALFVETPGSDIDVVCFTQQHGSEALGPAVDVLRRISDSLFALFCRYPNGSNGLSLKLIEDARVPILRVLWGPPGTCIAVDISVDQRRPLDHVRWFQRIGAAPGTSTPSPPIPPIVTSALRCVKWWLRQRQIPQTKEGCLPTLAWLLMALYTCQGRKTLSAVLSNFFFTYASFGGLDGTLAFCQESVAFEFKRKSTSKQPLSPWAELSVLDPTQGCAESSDLVPRLLPATQLLLVYELRRAHRHFAQSEAECNDSAVPAAAAFEAAPEGSTSLPSAATAPIRALLFLGDPAKGVGTVEVGSIDKIVPFPEWKAPFLHRSDTRSEIYVRLYDVDSKSMCCRIRPKSSMVLCPCHFICQLSSGALVKRAGDGSRQWAFSADDLDRLSSMQKYLQEIRDHQ